MNLTKARRTHREIKLKQNTETVSVFCFNFISQCDDRATGLTVA